MTDPLNPIEEFNLSPLKVVRVRFEQVTEDEWVAEALDLPGCVVQATTRPKAMKELLVSVFTKAMHDLVLAGVAGNPPGQCCEAVAEAASGLSADVPNAENEVQKELANDVMDLMNELGKGRWMHWDQYNGAGQHPNIAAWRGGFRAGYHVGITLRLGTREPNAGTILGYFERGPVRWMLTERKDGMLKGVEITPLGNVHTMHMAESSADKLVLISNDDYCLACWNCMPVGETCAVCGRINKGEQ